jgi:hypothetical protein
MLSYFLIFLMAFGQSNAQIEGPDAQGEVKFFYGNYSGVLILHSFLPSGVFHPVIGGSEFKYIR